MYGADGADLGTFPGLGALRATTLLWYLNHRALAQLAQSPLQEPGQLLHWVCPPKSVSTPDIFLEACTCEQGHPH